MLNRILAAIVDRLPAKTRPYAKSVLPFVATLVYVGVTVGTGGGFDADATKAALEGIALTGISFLFPNRGDLTVTASPKA